MNRKQRLHCFRSIMIGDLWFDFLQVGKRLKIPEPYSICQEKLHIRSAYNYPKEMYVASDKVGEAEPSKTFEIKISDIGYGAIWFGACPDGFKSWFGPVFFHFSSALE